jgi:replicative superfamily II helicase
MDKSIIEILNDLAISDNYMFYLLKKIQLNYGKKLFNLEYNLLSQKEFNDILRFSDILSRSESSLNKNISLKIISTLYDDYHNDDRYKLFSKNVLMKLGNFPSLRFIEESGNSTTNDEIEIEKIIKKIFQKTSNNNQYFTDTQYRTFIDLKNNKHFSFSAGTSFGKSFLFTEFVKLIIHEKCDEGNIAFLVPTRALITQVVTDLKKDIIEGEFKIVSSPDIPALFRDKKFIFVFTPERLVTYFSNEGNPIISTLIIDEAQNVIENDERSPLFYHAISLAKHHNINLYFASPNIPNPEIFLELVGKSKEESKHITDLNVVQNKFFVDFQNNKIKMYFDFVCEEETLEVDYKFPIFEEFLKNFTSTNQSLIYCNSVHETLEWSKKMSNTLPVVYDEKLIEFEQYIRVNIHENYYLADYIKYGVGFHFGALPQEVREKIEYLFKSGIIKYLFTTSTLLQGVNLPAKNLFILSDKIGKSKMSKLNFRNLSGRAGRLSMELYGNIFVVNLGKDVWGIKSQEILNHKPIHPIESKLLNGKKNFYLNIGNVLADKQMTNKNMTEWEKRQISDYASILAYQYKKKIDSKLIEQFNNRSNLYETFNIIDSLKVSDDILMISTNIKTKYQETILNETDKYIFNDKFDYYSCLDVLKNLYFRYSWDIEEDKKDLGNIKKLKYY